MSKNYRNVLQITNSIIVFRKHLGVAFKFDVKLDLIRFQGGELIDIWSALCHVTEFLLKSPLFVHLWSEFILESCLTEFLSTWRLKQYKSMCVCSYFHMITWIYCLPYEKDWKGILCYFLRNVYLVKSQNSEADRFQPFQIY